MTGVVCSELKYVSYEKKKGEQKIYIYIYK